MYRQIILALIFGAALLFSESLPEPAKAFFYGLSLSVKSLILFVLPIVVFGLLFKTLQEFSKKASSLIFVILFGIILSNFSSTLTAFLPGSLAYGLDMSLKLPKEILPLDPLFVFNLPQIIPTREAMLLGLVSGLVLSRFFPAFSKSLSIFFERGVARLLKGITLLIPLLILGFIVKMKHDQILGLMIKNYALIFVWVLAAALSYILFLYLLASGFRLKLAFERIKNILPASLTGFGAMSSAAAMPLTILGAEKNGKDPSLAASFIPATVNVHLVGDCFAIPIFSFAILKSFGMAMPDLITYFLFASYFVFAKFSVAAIPGGGILVMLPILEKTLGFTPEMLALITALYILFDPVITGMNVLGNGALALILEKFAPTPKRALDSEVVEEIDF